MNDILVTSPYRPFSLPSQFKAVFNGCIYCGTVDAVDPSVSQVQVYFVNESGDKVPVAQPLRTNAGGYIVYNGQPAKFVTDSNHSLLVRDSLGNQVWYEPNMANYDPESFVKYLSSKDGYKLVGSDQSAEIESFRLNAAMSDRGVWLAADEWAIENRGRIYVGGRDYFFNDSLSIGGIYVCSGIGRTRLVFSGGGDGVEFYPPAGSSGWQFGFEGGVSVVTDGVNAGTAVKARKGLYFKQRPKLKIESIEISDKAGPNMSVSGFPCVNAWSVGLDVGDVQGCDVGEYYYYGNYNPLVSDVGQFNSVALRMSSNETMLFPRFGALWFNAPRRGIEIGDKCFFFVDSVDVTRCWEGVVSTSPTPFSEVFINKLAINAQKTGVDLANITRLSLGESFVNSRADGFEHTDEWVGYKLTNINKSAIGAIQAQPNKRYGGTTAVMLVGGGGVHLESVIAGANIDVGLLADNCAGYKATVIWQSALPDPAVPYKAVNKARSASVDVVLTPSTANDPFHFDETIDTRQQNIRVSGGGGGQKSHGAAGLVVGGIDFCDYRNTKEPHTSGRLVAGIDGTVSLQISDEVSGSGQNALIVTRAAGTNTINATELRGTETITPTTRPNAANVRTSGTASFPWAGGFTQAAFTVTSDANYKTDPLEITDAMLDAAEEVNWVQYQYLDRVAEKGEDGARWHFGAVAQSFVEAFARHGLDAHRFGFICYDEWGESAAVIDAETGEVISPAIEAGSRYGIRYEEALALEAALQRRNYLRLSARLTALEAK